MKTTRTYTISANEATFELVDRILLTVRALGSRGASRTVLVDVDGDGPIGLEVEELRTRRIAGATIEQLTELQQFRLPREARARE